ncbi:hypothetical protein EDD37DRAFT_633997 [Exophiala viscosa]|uniref:uncharacterized protein n=1 Tax=Exophiala viscosa TaxID=2486360 RepID=UPI0021927093|nr:hypothetical protein EDD37DRAFT_633997 [Exophiala viscosa]
MPGEATILEGPVTPAPLFAYRAVRGIFFRSPDSTPEYNNKENVDPTPVSSPQKSNTMDERLQLTPTHKRKRDGGAVMLSPSKAMLSPTKGILRTPGLATPRAKLLKDINVKFKSVSPESAQQRHAAIKNIGLANTNSNAIKSASSSKDPGHPLRISKSMGDLEPAKRENKVAAAADKPTKTSVPVTVNTTAFPPSAMDAYMQQTEKEMKKLVRYGQKMREYARQKDAENVELKSMVEKLHRENERLRRAAPSEAEAKQEQDRHGNVREGATQSHVSRTPSNRVKSAKESTREGSMALRLTTTKLRRPSASIPVSIADTRPAPPGSSHRNKFDHTPPPASTKAHSKTETNPLGHALPVRSASSGAPSAHMNNDTAANLPAKNDIGTGSTRLAPERLAAARERLRRRAEARKTSVEHDQDCEGHVYNDSPPKKMQQREGILIDINIDGDADAMLQPQTAGQSREQSVLDWVNL